jgi:hypothetical protein
VDAISLLCREQVVHQELNGFRRISPTGEAVPVELVGELERIPVADGLEELDVAGDLATISSVPSSRCQKPCSANSRRKAGSERTPRGK